MRRRNQSRILAVTVPARRRAVVAALIVLTCGAALTACGGQPSAAAPRSPRPSPSTQAPPPVTSSPTGAPSSPVPSGVITVRLTAAFTPSTVTVQAGQQILIEVSSAVRVSGPAFPSACPSPAQPVAGGMLSLRCTAGGYLLTAQRPGSATLSVNVRPRCSPGSMCPQWITTATLAISIT